MKKKRRVSMVKIREILRLHFQEHLSQRQIALSLNIHSKSTIERYLKRAKELGISWPLPDELNDEEKLRALFSKKRKTSCFTPQWSHIHQELKKKGVTLELLWQEYKEDHPDGYSYCHFCALFRSFQNTLPFVMRFEHKAGEKLFVDWAGMTQPFIDPQTKEVKAAQIFVATLGGSSYTFAKGYPDQGLSSWIEAHTEAFAFFGGLPQILVPDNTKTAVRRANYYDPELNRTYHEMAQHYGVMVLPARVRQPKDKAKVEAAVKVVERWVLAPLRNQSLTGLCNVNQAIQQRLRLVNEKPIKGLGKSRKEVFEAIEKAELKALPDTPYEFGYWKHPKVPPDYHIEIEGHHYSVPYTLCGKTVSVKTTQRMIHIFFNHQSIVSHIRSHRKGGFTTIAEHMPEAHRRYQERLNPEKLLGWASSVGPSAKALMEKLLRDKRFTEHIYRFYLGLKNLKKRYGNEKVEKAISLFEPFHQRPSYQRLKRVLELELFEEEETLSPKEVLKNSNVRGAHYYK